MEAKGPNSVVRKLSAPVKSAISSVNNSLTTGHSDPVERWLLALHDPLAGIYTFSSCIAFADLFNDGDMKLAVVDLGNGMNNIKLNVYKGTILQSQLTLIDVPSSISPFYMDSSPGHTPALAVSAGHFLYIYKNLKPFYKFQLPPLTVNQTEIDAWNQVKEEKIDLSALKDILSSLKYQATEIPLTAVSLKFLSLTTETEMTDFVSKQKQHPLKRNTVITCVQTLKRSMSEDDAISCLVIGTENKEVFFVEPDAFTILSTTTVPSVPAILDAHGLYEVEFRVIVSCRDSCLYTMKRGFKTAKLLVQLPSHAVGICQINSNIVVGCMDRNLCCYSSKGVSLWSINLPANITALDGMNVEHLAVKPVAVALENNQVAIYLDKHRVDVINTPEVVTSMKYGKYGRESGTLVTISRQGSLTIRILKRTVKFYPKETTPAIITAANKLILPKKTKLFLEQTMREKEEAQAIHRMFQQDIYRLRLMTARSYVKAITSSMNPVSANSNESLKLSAQVHGLGPVFRLVIELVNSSQRPSINLFLTFDFDSKLYSLDKTYIPIAFMVSGVSYQFDTLIRCISSLNVTDTVKVFVMKEGNCIPSLTAVINMPASESQT